MSDKKTTIKALKLDPKNANKHSQYGTGLLENSLRDNGAGRSILISNDDVVIAGNGTVEGAAAIGIEKVRVIETDGNEIIAVKRTDIKSGTAAFHKMAFADNIVPLNNIVFDAEVVEAIAEEYPSTKAYAALILDPPGEKNNPDTNKAGLTTKSFPFTDMQIGKVNKALKISKELNKEKMKSSGNDNENSNALFFIITEYLKNHK